MGGALAAVFDRVGGWVDLFTQVSGQLAADCPGCVPKEPPGGAAAFEVLGVDAAPNAVLRALKNKIPTFPALFDEKSAKLIFNEFGSAKVLMANQCIAHVDNLIDFMKGVELLLDKKNGVFIFVMTIVKIFKSRNYRF